MLLSKADGIPVRQTVPGPTAACRGIMDYLSYRHWIRILKKKSLELRKQKSRADVESPFFLYFIPPERRRGGKTLLHKFSLEKEMDSWQGPSSVFWNSSG